MSARRNQSLNLSGFSPIQVNTYSPQSIKSPGKDYGINERIEVGREKLLSGYDRWKLAENNGNQCLQIIHNIKDKARGSPYPPELETYCTKLAMVRTVLGDVIKSVAEVKKEISGSISILESMNDNEELKSRLKTVEKFLHRLLQLYEKNLELKNFIIENAAHAPSSNDSLALLASWACSMNQNEIFQLITQLKMSPPKCQWIV